MFTYMDIFHPVVKSESCSIRPILPETPFFNQEVLIAEKDSRFKVACLLKTGSHDELQ